VLTNSFQEVTAQITAQTAGNEIEVLGGMDTGVVAGDAFYIAQVNDPDGKLTWSDLMYFSFTVLTSTGFGEITPVTPMARSLIVIEQVLGVMYVAFLVARLANLYGRTSGR